MRKPGTQSQNKRGHGKNQQKVTFDDQQRTDGKDIEGGGIAGKSVKQSEDLKEAVHPT